jgi:hypothetical protein
MSDKPSPVTIIYKSGAKVTFDCTNFIARKRNGELVEVEWKNPSVRPLHIGVDDIAAIWDGRV